MRNIGVFIWRSTTSITTKKQNIKSNFDIPTGVPIKIENFDFKNISQINFGLNHSFALSGKYSLYSYIYIYIYIRRAGGGVRIRKGSIRGYGAREQEQRALQTSKEDSLFP